ncbi:T9SS type A sorting domain-containing protein [Epilithonimonas hungarica]|uniref:Por secretion system C-terminal sorting domain-containing protein n=1 Tax=Epilithonimonas hungarica TaxID=454006 RepID=A0A1G7U0I1_9FLAO|nr:T9SS type A sorting domain-containing protein [Epilithonimonas hungarica]SDG41056.1 Por secretion system C-terminal sorting domain-containing protein [Epilithonimonas hungarica]
MKKTLLLLAFSVVAAVSDFKAQTNWDFGTWDNIAAVTAPVVKNNLGLVPGENVTTFGVVEGNTANFASNPDAEGFNATKRFKFGGGGFDTGMSNAVPTKRYIVFKVTGNSAVKIWYKNGGGGDRTLYLGNGSTVFTSKTASNSTDPLVLDYQYVGGATDLYIYGDQAINIYKIRATNVGTTVLGVSDVKKEMKANIFSSGNKVYVSNLESKNTQISVFNANGSLVKSASSSVDTNFEINNKGVYFVNLKSDAGVKSTKVLIK